MQNYDKIGTFVPNNNISKLNDTTLLVFKAKTDKIDINICSLKSMSKLLAVGTVAFDAIETPFGKTDKILGGSGTFVGLAASQFGVQTGVVSVVGGDFPDSYLSMM